MPRTWPSQGAVYFLMIGYAILWLGAFVLGLLFRLLLDYRRELLHEDHVRAINDVTPDTNRREGQTESHETEERRRSVTGRPFLHGLLFVIQYVLGFCIVMTFFTGHFPFFVAAVMGGLLGILIKKCREEREHEA